MQSNQVREEFDRTGRVWFRNALSESNLDMLATSANLEGTAGQRIHPDSSFKAFFSREGDLAKLMSTFGDDLIPVRIVAFNKTGESNWGVPWHQDRVIALDERHDIPGFRNWSQKSGVWHCEPPAEILEKMFFVRIHLDENIPENGGMKIATGSHRLGIVPSASAQSTAENHPLEECRAARGDVLVLKMLTLHASSPSQQSSPRRVFRVDYAPRNLLPIPLTWI